MKSKRLAAALALTFLSIAGLLVAGPARAGEDDAPGIVVYTIEASLEDVLLDISDAIINRGLVIDNTARVGEMLNRTAADVEATRTVYKGAVVTQFCSAVLSRRAMEADPMNIAFCPYGVFAFELADRPGTVHVGYRRLVGRKTPASRAALDEVNALLDSIAREVAGL